MSKIKKIIMLGSIGILAISFFTFDTQKAKALVAADAAPVAYPDSGTYYSAQNVTLSHVMAENSEIYYTTDGSTPDESSTLYTEAVLITKDTTLKAVAKIDIACIPEEEGTCRGFILSDIMTEEYTIKTAPVASPDGGSYDSAQAVTLTKTMYPSLIGPHRIYYTTDGSTPSVSSTLYTGPISISRDTTLKAISINTATIGIMPACQSIEGEEQEAKGEGDEGIQACYFGGSIFAINSEIMVEEYTIGTAPSASPAGGNYDSTQNVTLSKTMDTTLDGTHNIYYTTDGSTPSSSSTLYSSPISISEDTTLKAISINRGTSFLIDDPCTTVGELVLCHATGDEDAITSISSEIMSESYTFDSDEENKDEKKKEPAPKATRKIGEYRRTVTAGETITQYGKRFSKNSNVALYFSKSNGLFYPPKVIKTDSKGNFLVTYKIPASKAKGKYKWYVVDLKSGAKTKALSYTVK